MFILLCWIFCLTDPHAILYIFYSRNIGKTQRILCNLVMNGLSDHFNICTFSVIKHKSVTVPSETLFIAANKKPLCDLFIMWQICIKRSTPSWRISKTEKEKWKKMEKQRHWLLNPLKWCGWKLRRSIWQQGAIGSINELLICPFPLMLWQAQWRTHLCSDLLQWWNQGILQGLIFGHILFDIWVD